jgi:hypothetical protein
MPRQEKATADRPVHEIRHRAVRATIWKNQTPKGPMYNVTVSRRFKDGEDWKDSRSFGFQDLLTLSKALVDAHTFISAQEAKERARTRKNSPAPKRQSDDIPY